MIRPAEGRVGSLTALQGEIGAFLVEPQAFEKIAHVLSQSIASTRGGEGSAPGLGLPVALVAKAIERVEGAGNALPDGPGVGEVDPYVAPVILVAHAAGRESSMC